MVNYETVFRLSLNTMMVSSRNRLFPTLLTVEGVWTERVLASVMLDKVSCSTVYFCRIMWIVFQYLVEIWRLRIAPLCLV